MQKYQQWKNFEISKYEKFQNESKCVNIFNLCFTIENKTLSHTGGTFFTKHPLSMGNGTYFLSVKLKLTRRLGRWLFVSKSPERYSQVRVPHEWTHIANLNANLPAACLRPKRSQKQTYWQGASSGAGSFDLNKQWRVRTQILYPCLGLFFQHTSQPFNNRLSGPQRKTSTIFLKISAIAHNLLTRSKYNHV